MDYLVGLLNSVVDTPESVKWTIYIISGVAGITLAVAMSLIFSGTYSPIRSKLLSIENVDGQEGLSKNISNTLEYSLDKVSFLGRSFAGDNKTKKLLMHSGFHSDKALKIYNAIKLLMLLLAAVITLFSIQSFPELSTFTTIYLVGCILGVCYLLPGMILTYIANRRMQSLRKFFPDALDLLVVCCESGLGLLESIQRVSKEMGYAQPALAHELALVCSKVRVGYSIQDALHEFTDRTGLEDIRGLNSVIVQSLRLGTGIADTLRIYSEEYRDKRLQAAEESAAKVGVKMIFPMMCCIWPSFFIVAIGPAVLKVMAVWDQAF